LEIGASKPAVLHRGIYMALKARDNDDRMPMSKVSPALLAVMAAVWLVDSPVPAQTMPDPTPSANDSVDRVAAARLQHGASIRQKYHNAAVAYPGEIFLRWLKREAVVELWARESGHRFRLVFRYPILAVSGAPGPKRREGDRQVPEGFYEIDRFNPKSLFHLSLGLNYPNAADLILSDRAHPGSDIFIHGSDVSIGCAPLGDEAIEEVYLAALDAHEHGQSRIEVHVFPDRMSGPEWEQYATSEITRQPMLKEFWAQLQPGFAYFEQHRTLPKVTVEKDGRYTVHSMPGSAEPAH
jgi:murein L,D-transpeptidase YafK